MKVLKKFDRSKKIAKYLPLLTDKAFFSVAGIERKFGHLLIHEDKKKNISYANRTLDRRLATAALKTQ